jgi:hypothetical protein
VRVRGQLAGVEGWHGDAGPLSQEGEEFETEGWHDVFVQVAPGDYESESGSGVILFDEFSRGSCVGSKDIERCSF